MSGETSQRVARGLCIERGYKGVGHARTYGFKCVFYGKCDLAWPGVCGTSYGMLTLG